MPGCGRKLLGGFTKEPLDFALQKTSPKLAQSAGKLRNLRREVILRGTDLRNSAVS